MNRTLVIGGDMTVNRLGYGAMHLTGPGMWGPPLDPDNAVRVLRRAVELGVEFIDTADSYGPGDNERTIKQALHPYPDGLVISTKAGMLRSGPDDWNHQGPPYIEPLGRPKYLRQQVEMSLRNLGVERIDLYQLHSIDPKVPLEDQIGELVRLQQQGKIRHIGISEQPGISVSTLQEARTYGKIASVENLCNVADRALNDATLCYTAEHGIAFIAWFPLGHGGLVAPCGPLASLAMEWGATAAQLALAWLLHRSPTTVLIPGTASLSHLEENMKAHDLTLTERDMAAIEEAVDLTATPAWPPVPAQSSATSREVS